MKFRYKIIITVVAFLVALVLFSGGIQRSIFKAGADTVEMISSTLPTVTIESGGNEINRLHGYVSNLDEMIMRETITPISSDRTFTVLIDENTSSVKKLKYEILNEDGDEIESDSFTVLDSENGPKKVRISLKETMKSGKEYVAKITLITNQSKRIYFYTRIKMYDDGHLYEKLEFAKNFHDILLKGTQEEKDALKKYLESSKAADNSSYASVNIKSSFEMVCYGDLEPQVISEEVPTVTEFYDGMASIRLTSLVKVELDSTEEYYVVKEDFRFAYTASRVYLYNYDRNMEAVFDVDNTSLMKDEFKLGITSDTKAQTAASESKKYCAFVYGRELMLYDSEKNVLNCVFSFREDNYKLERDFFDDHEVRLVKVHDNGNVDFVVYGYMNRGEYEGRVGIILYRFVKNDERIEEQLYIPINSSYKLLKADMTEFEYLSSKDIYYFSIYDSIYQYDLVKREAKTIASDVPSSNLIYCEEEQYIAWQECRDITKAGYVCILNLETGETKKISGREGEKLRLYGRIDNNIIYGYSKSEDAVLYADGNVELPSYKLCIADGNANVLKEYQTEGIYISGIEIGDNMLRIKRVSKNAAGTAYTEAADDSIMNRKVTVTRPVEIVKRVTDRMLTEYYVDIPSGIDIAELPKYVKAANTIINYSTTTRVNEPEDRTKLYYAYSFGEVVFASPDAAEVISEADKQVGTVINKDGRLIWERGVKTAHAAISGITNVNADAEHDGIQAALKMLLQYKNIDRDTTDFNYEKNTVYSWLYANMKSTPVDLTGATLDEVLYYVYKSRPVIAITGVHKACVITAYDSSTVTYYDTTQKKVCRVALKEAVEMFEKAGNIFISYVD